LEQAAFAALVPNSAEKVLSEVIEEITGDHEMLVYVASGCRQPPCFSSSVFTTWTQNEFSAFFYY
jgi:hypothetical protein